MNGLFVYPILKCLDILGVLWKIIEHGYFFYGGLLHTVMQLICLALNPSNVFHGLNMHMLQHAYNMYHYCYHGLNFNAFGFDFLNRIPLWKFLSAYMVVNVD